MNILIENSQGELITIMLQDTDTFRELNRRMEKEYGLQMDFTNLYGKEDIDLDENILTSLTKSNQLIPIEAESTVLVDAIDTIDKSLDEENNLQTKDQQEVAIYSNRTHLSTIVENEETVELPRSYQFISLDDFHLWYDMVVNSENKDVIVKVEDADTREFVGIENNKLLHSQNLVETATKIIWEISDDIALPLCRLCAHRSDKMVYIFGSSQSGQEIAKKIDDCLPIIVKKTDTLPKHICHSCLEKLEMCHEFQKTVIEAEMNFLKMDCPKLLYSKAIKKNCPLCRQSTLKTNDNFNASRDKEMSLVNQGTCDSVTVASTNLTNISAGATENNYISSKKVANEFIKSLDTNENHSFRWKMKNISAGINEQESTGFKEYNENMYATIVPVENHIPVTIVSSPSRQSPNRSQILKKIKQTGFSTDKSETRTDHLEEIPRNKQFFNGKTCEKDREICNNKQIDQHEDYNCSDSKKQCTNNDIEARNFLNENNVHKTVKCRICGEAFQSSKKCHIHSRIHSREGYYPCSLCDKTFTTEEDCNEHSIEHTEGKKCERRLATHACTECGKKFVTEERLQFHLTFHKPDARPCYCKKCNKCMVSESSLYHHLLTVHLQYREFCCDICGKQFRAQAQLDAHQRKHKDERPFECTMCKKRFYSNEILKRHKKLHLPDKPYQCDQCGKRFGRTNSLTKHLLRHQVEAGRSMLCYVCTACNEIFVDASSGNSHATACKLTKRNGDERIEERNLSAMYKCEFCERCYTEVKFMKMHRECHSGAQPYVCTICDITYATYNQVTAHKSAHKKSLTKMNMKENIVIPTYFACEHCDKQFLHFTNMNVHRKTCASGKSWMCRYCGFVFENAKQLSKHKKGKDSEESWLCEECNATVSSICALEMHKETHSGTFVDKKTFVCLYCRKEFIQKTHLTIHIRSHTGERPYACDLCSKAYKIKTERDNHRRIHTGERPFNCTLCEKTFTNRARLREHTRFHSGVRPYKCNLCERAFKKANARKVHMTIHTGEKPFQCDVCSIYFRRMGDMRKHRRTQHGAKRDETLDNSNGNVS